MDTVNSMADEFSEEQRYRLMVDNPHDVIYRSNADSTFRWVSESITDVLGWHPVDLVGTSIDAVVHPDDLAATTATGARSGTEFPFRRSSMGHPRPFGSGVATENTAGRRSLPCRSSLRTDLRTASWAACATSTTWLTAREQALASQQLTQSAFDKLLDPLLVMRPVRDAEGVVVDFEYLEANPAACQYNGMTHARMIGSRLLDINPGNRDNGEFDLILQVFETGVPLILDGHPYDQELLGGERRFYDLRVARAGEVLVYTWRDVTERHLVERELATREDLYRLVTEDVTDAVVRFDDHAIITWVSPSFERLTGYPSDVVVGQSAMRLLPPDQVAFAEEAFAGLLADRIGSGLRLQIRRADGQVRWIDAQWRPFVLHDGTVDGRVTVLRDVTLAVDAEVQRDHEIGHDPLTGLANRSLAIARIDRALDELVGDRTVRGAALRWHRPPHDREPGTQLRRRRPRPNDRRGSCFRRCGRS